MNTYGRHKPLVFSDVPEGAKRVYAALCEKCGTMPVLMFDREKAEECMYCYHESRDKEKQDD